MGEADWVLYLVIVVLAAAAVCTLWHCAVKIAEIMANVLRSHHLSMHDDVIECLNDIKREVKEVRAELRRSQGLDDGDISWED